jgi:predicted small metal-binding protein
MKGDNDMKTFACGDVVPGCEARWVASTDEEILVLVAQHADVVHGVPELSPEVVSMVAERIGTVS